MTRAAVTLALKIVVSAGLLAILLRQSDPEALWAQARAASAVWLGIALALYFLMILTSAWRWGYLLTAQQVDVPIRTLLGSFMVATFFNNFLPSNIGGDVIRIRDTVDRAGSKTVATVIVLLDRALGLVGLLIVAALAATTGFAIGEAGPPVHPALLWAAVAASLGAVLAPMATPSTVQRLLRPLRVIHREWVEERLARLVGALVRFRGQPWALANCLAGAVIVQLVIVAFYAAIAHSLDIPISWSQLAVIVPMSLIVQMLPVSVNGFGVREAAFTYYFLRLRLPIESALVLSLLGAGLTLLFSVSGAVVYAWRR